MPLARLVFLALLVPAASGASSYQPALHDDDVCDRGISRCALSALQRSHRHTANLTGSFSLARQSMKAVLREAAQINATQGLGLAMVATFTARAAGFMSLTASPIGVIFGTSGLSIEASLVQEICGNRSGNGRSGFAYHINNFWLHTRRASAYGYGCGPHFTGGHWDPTAACGPSSGNPVCSKCFAGLLYDCSPHSFQWWNSDQYKRDNLEACELGDLSGMFGTLKVGKKTRGAVAAAGIWGIAQMSAGNGVVRDQETCKPEKPGFIRASSDLGFSLNQLVGRSIVVSCPGDYANAGAELVCAKLI